MEKLRILSVFGTRPEAIKMCPLVQELANREGIESLCCVTAQHRQMLDSVLEVFQVKPDWDLDIMTPRQTLSTITSKCLTGMDEAIDALKPDMILVHGDTSTTFAGALSAFYHQVSVGHVEAGLRTYDKYSPFPEEMNRKLVGDIADLHFCPTTANRDNLAREELAVNDPAGLTRDLLRLCAFRYAPHFLKPQLWMYSNVFLPYAQAQGEPVYEVTDPAFDARLREEGLEATVERAFRLIHLTGMHPPYTMDADCQHQAQGVTAQEQMRGCLRLAEDYLEQLRALGVYDRSAVLILADHGTDTVHRPLLLLKRPGDTGEMAVNDAPVSYADLPATYVALLTGAQAGTELWSIPQGQARTRLYYHESSRNNAFNLYEYSTQALSPSWEELIPTGRVFHGDSLEAAAPYTLGETLYFDLRATARPYLVSGFSSADFHSTWTVGESGRISLPLARLPRSDTLTVEMKFLSIMGGSQRLRVDCGGQTVFEGTVTDYTLRFSFPASLVQDQALTLDFTYPDAISHLKAGLSEDTRQVAFAVTELTVLDGV